MGKAQDIDESPSTNPPGPSKLTVYPASTLRHGANDVAIYFPDAYVPGNTVNLLVYFHGLLDRCGSSSEDTMQKYLKNSHFPLRELTNHCKKNMVLVVPRLVGGAYGLETGMDADAFLQKVVAYIAGQSRLTFQWKALTPAAMKGYEKSDDGFLREHKHAVADTKPAPPEMTIGKLILAAHSGGGVPMLNMALTVTVAKVQECWGFDSMYGSPKTDWVEDTWVKWASQRGRKYFLFWTTEGGNNSQGYGETITTIQKRLHQADPPIDPKKAKDPAVVEADLAAPNITVVFAEAPSKTDLGFARPPGRLFSASTTSHCDVPKTYWRDMMNSF